MSTLAPDFTVTHIPEQTFAYVVRSVAPHEVGEFIGGAIERVRAFAAGHGGTEGPPMAIVRPPDDHGTLVLEVGFPVPAGTEPEAPVEVSTLPASVALVHLHVGGYDELPVVYRELSGRMRKQGYTPVAPPRERYLTVPGDGPPVTEIVWPVA